MAATPHMIVWHLVQVRLLTRGAKVPVRPIPGEISYVLEVLFPGYPSFNLDQYTWSFPRKEREESEDSKEILPHKTDTVEQTHTCYPPSVRVLSRS